MGDDAEPPLLRLLAVSDAECFCGDFPNTAIFRTSIDAAINAVNEQMALQGAEGAATGGPEPDIFELGSATLLALDGSTIRVLADALVEILAGSGRLRR